MKGELTKSGPSVSMSSATEDDGKAYCERNGDGVNREVAGDGCPIVVGVNAVRHEGEAVGPCMPERRL
jgi:hypothetical protein